MERGTFDALIDQALAALGCEGCREEYLERLAPVVVSGVAHHNAANMANQVMDKELTLVEAFDRLTDELRPLYALIGQDVNESELAHIRRRVEQLANLGMN